MLYKIDLSRLSVHIHIPFTPNTLLFPLSTAAWGSHTSTTTHCAATTPKRPSASARCGRWRGASSTTPLQSPAATCAGATVACAAACFTEAEKLQGCHLSTHHKSLLDLLQLPLQYPAFLRRGFSSSLFHSLVLLRDDLVDLFERSLGLRRQEGRQCLMDEFNLEGSLEHTAHSEFGNALE